MSKYIFSGHESFPCRFLWLKKGYDFLKAGKKFNDLESISDLGVGKNMVSSIKYWMESFGLIDKNEELTDFAYFIFDEDEGNDQYLEYIGTLWILHNKLIIQNRASIYSLFYNEFIKSKVEFSKNQLLDYLKTKVVENQQTVSENTLYKDINVFLMTYIANKNTANYEDEMLTLLIELNLLSEATFEAKKGEKFYIAERKKRDIPEEVFLTSILMNQNYGKSITFDELLTGFNSPGNIFLLSAEGLYELIIKLMDKYKFITYKDDSGVKVMQIRDNISYFDVLENYYDK